MHIITVLLNKVSIYVCGGVTCLIVTFCSRFFHNTDSDKFSSGHCSVMKSVTFITLPAITV